MKAAASDSKQNDGQSIADVAMFKPSRVIMMSELNNDEKERYYNLILSNNVKLQYTDNQFVANIRLIGPVGDAYEENRVKEVENIEKEKDNQNQNQNQNENHIPRRHSMPPTTSANSRKSSLGYPLEKRMHRLQNNLNNNSNTNLENISISFKISGVASFDTTGFHKFCSLIGK